MKETNISNVILGKLKECEYVEIKTYDITITNASFPTTLFFTKNQDLKWIELKHVNQEKLSEAQYYSFENNGCIVFWVENK